MKVLVLGGEGMLGHKMFQILGERFAARCTIYGSLDDPFYRGIDIFRPERVIERVDAMDWPRLERLLLDLRPEFLVNCVGIIKQREEARSPIPTITLNSLLPHRLAEVAARYGGRVVHISTDCVFSGRKGSYTEDDQSDAEDLYGRSKYLGEVTGENALTLRTSIIGRELAQFRSLLEWFLGQRGEVRGFTRVLYSGVTTNYLARLVGRIIEERPTLSGLYQVVSPPISKHDLLTMLKEAYHLDTRIVPDAHEVSDRTMVGEKFVRATGFDQPSWPALVAELAADPTPYDKWRSR
jgi:dTDP-4-dehydrorhamnose reductase